MRTFLFMIYLAICCLESAAQVYVKANATGLNNGTSWQNAYTDLSTAINTVTAGEIWIAAGVYKPTTDSYGAIPANNRTLTFRLKKNITLYGGFTGTETSLSQRNYIQNLTILSGDIGLADDSTDNTYNVVTGDYMLPDETSILDGVTVTRGTTNGCGTSNNNGGGIYINYSPGTKFIIRNCIIEKNFGCEGGGMFVFNAKPLLENNIFRKNNGSQGAAVYLYYSNATIKNNVFTENIADGNLSDLSGGAIYIFAYSSPVITNNLITKNYARHEGGGISIESNYHTVIANNVITENISRDGAGVFLDNSQTFFFNNVIAKNHALRYGGGIYMDYTPGPKLLNNTIALNKADFAGGGLYLTAANVYLTNTVFYYNTSPDGKQAKVIMGRTDWFPRFNYCSVEKGTQGIVSSGAYEYNNTSDKDPKFSDTSTLNLHISAISPLTDAGTLDSAIFKYPWLGSNLEVITFPAVDLEGNPRIYNDLIDIGAYELPILQEFEPTSITLSNARVDRNADTGTLVGKLSTIDPDSETFFYTLLNNIECFSIHHDSLLTKCLLKNYYTSPSVNIKIKSSDDNGWSVEKTFDIELTDVVTGISEPQQQFSVYPNPTTGLILFNGNFPPGMNIQVYSTQGELVLSAKLSNTKTVDISRLSSGIYYFLFSHKQKTYHTKMIKL